MQNIRNVQHNRFNGIQGELSMFQAFQSKSRSILGIDIRASSVKVVQISTSFKQGLCVQSYGCESLPPQALKEGLIQNIDLVACCIRTLLQKTKCTAKRAALAIPDSAVIRKIMQMKKGLSKVEMEEWVMIEASKYIPYPVEEMHFDFEILGH